MLTPAGDGRPISRSGMISTAPFPEVRRFEVFEVNLRSREMKKEGRRVRLQAQPFQVLAMLLESPGEAVSREELCQQLWSPDTFVDFDHGLNSAVSRLREALHDSASAPRLIETVPRFGYRFIGELQQSPAPDSGNRPSAFGRVRALWLAVAGILALVLSGTSSQPHNPSSFTPPAGALHVGLAKWSKTSPGNCCAEWSPVPVPAGWFAEGASDPLPQKVAFAH